MSASDLVIVDLADEVAELRERVALTESYRGLVHVAVEQLTERTRELERARQRIAALVAELRELRGSAAA